MSRFHWIMVLLSGLSLWAAGCEKSKPAPTTAPQGTTATTAEAAAPQDASHDNALHQTDFGPMAGLGYMYSSQEAEYHQAMLSGLAAMAERKYPEALAEFEKAKKAQDTDSVRLQIDKVRVLIAQQTTLQTTLQDIEAILHQGRAEEASKLATQALAQFGTVDDTGRLMVLKRQADAMWASQADQQQRKQRLQAEIEQARKEDNLRALLLAYEQWLTLEDDAETRRKSAELRQSLTTYDDLRQRAAELRKDPQQWEQALALLQEAAKAWNTPLVRDEIADCQLAIQSRRDRLSVADFEVRGDVGFPMAGPTLADELLPHFKSRFDLVERSQQAKVMAELKVEPHSLIDQQEQRSEVGRMAQIKYLVVGSLASLNGLLTVNARLVEASSGLIVQTGRVTARNSQELMQRLPELAQQLLMTDEEKLAYQQRLQADVPPPVPVEEALKELPPLQPQAPPPPPIITTAAKPPAFGNLRIDDFQRLPPPPPPGQVVPTTSLSVPLAPSLQQRLFALQIELGENLFRRGHYQEAMFHFELAQQLGPTRMDIEARIAACRPHLPPPVVIIQPVPRPPIYRERIAILNFLIVGDPRVVPPGLSGWTPERLAPYFSPPFDVVDQGQLFWYMTRLGLNVYDVMSHHAARRWLARALRVRYFVFGVVQQTNSYTVTTHMVDAEFGYEVGRGSIFVRSQFELKLRLAELARLTLLGPTERIRLQQEAIAREAALLEAQQAMNGGQWVVAVELFGRLKKRYPFDVQITFMNQQAEQRALQAQLELQRRQEWERQQALHAERARRQAELALAAEAARRQAAAQAAMAEAERQRLLQQRQAASQQLLIQARVALGQANFTIAIQQFESAAALHPSEAILLELAQARARDEELRRQRTLQEMARRDQELRRQRERELADARARHEEERRRRDQAERDRLLELQNNQRAAYQRLLDDSQLAMAKGEWAAAVSFLQSARQLQRTDEVERLLNQALMEQARASAKAQDAAKLAELERKLAEEKAKRKAAEELAKQNEQLYLAALEAARKAEQEQQHELALAKYEEAGRLFKTDHVLTGMERNRKALQTRQQEQADRQRREQQEQRRRGELTRLKQQAQQAEAQKQFEQALQSYEEALKLAPGDVELLTGQSRARIARDQSLVEKRLHEAARHKEARAAELNKLARSSIAAKQFDAAEAYIEELKKTAPQDPTHPLLVLELETARKRQEAELAKAKADEKAKAEAERRRQTQMAEEERRKQTEQLSRYLAQADQALLEGQFELAQTYIQEAAKLARTDPRIGQMQRKWEQAKRTADLAKAKAEADAKTKAESRKKEHKKQYEDLMRAGREALSQKNYQDAVNNFKEALKLFPNDGDASLLLGMAEKYHQAEVVATEREKREAAEKAKAEADAKAKADAEEKARIKEREEAKAREEARVKQELQQRRSQSQAQLRLGRTAMNEGRFEDAMRAFQEALRLDPTNEEATTQLALARQRNEARKKAEEEAASNQQQDAAKKQAELQAALKAGQDAMAAKRYNDAIKAFEQVLKIDPNHTEAKFRLNLARQLAKEPTRPVDTSPAGKDDAAKKQAEFMSHMRAGAAAFAAKKYEEAVQHYTAAVQLNPRDPLANRALNDSKKALEDSKKRPPGQPTQPSRPDPRPPVGPAQGQNPNQAEYARQMQLGQQMDRQRKWAEAIAAYQAALAAVPNDPRAKAALNMAEFNQFMQTGQQFMQERKNAEAVKAFEAALERIPNHPEATRRLQEAKRGR